MEHVAGFVSNPIVQGAAIATTLISFVGALWTGYKRHRAGVVWSLKSDMFFNFTLDGFEGLRLTSDSSESAVVGFRSFVILTNRTSETVVDSDFVEMPNLEISPGGAFLSQKVLQGPDLGSTRLTVSGTRMALSEIVLKPRSSMLIVLVHSGGIGGRVDGVMKKYAFRNYTPRREPVFVPYALGALTSGILVFADADPIFVISCMMIFGLVIFHMGYWTTRPERRYINFPGL